MRHIVSVFVLLSIIWLSNSGFFTPLFLFYGLVSVSFVTWLTYKMDVIDHESQPVHLTYKIAGYYWWLLVQVVKSNVDVVSHVWRRKLAISPCVDFVHASQHTDMGKVIFANSITLTPGTVALDLDGDRIKVHALTREGMADLKTGEMDKRVSALES